MEHTHIGIVTVLLKKEMFQSRISAVLGTSTHQSQQCQRISYFHIIRSFASIEILIYFIHTQDYLLHNHMKARR